MNKPISLNIIYQSTDYIVINKPAGLLSQNTSNEYGSIISVLQVKFPKVTPHLLSRLDRPVSGAMLISKNAQFTKKYLNLQEHEKVLKTYIAIVEGIVEKDQQKLKHYHWHDRKWKKGRISDQEVKKSRIVELSVKKVKQLEHYTILEVQLFRGAFHQIRSQLAYIGHPIKGDVKYGARRGNRDRSISLHSYLIEWENTPDEKDMHFAPLPKNDNLWGIVEDTLKEQNG